MADYATGWTRAKVAATVYAVVDTATERSSGSFSTEPADGITTSLGCFRTANTLRGSFASGTWTFTLIAKSITNASGAYQLGVKVYRSASADGSTGLTRISPSGWQYSTTITASTSDQTVTLTPTIGARLDNEYLFFDIVCKITTAGTNNGADTLLRLDNAGCRFTTSDFVDHTATTISTSLQSFWRLDGLTDSIGSNNWTNNNAVAFSTGKIANAAYFDGSANQNLSIADNASLSTADIDFTVSAWTYMDTIVAGKEYRLLNRWGGVHYEYSGLYNQGDSRFEMFVSSDDGAHTAQVAANNFGVASAATWYHVVYWHDSLLDQIGIAINDGTPDVAAYSSGMLDTAATTYIGHPTQSGAVYRVDAMGWWKRVLFPSEITLMNNGMHGRELPLISSPPIHRTRRWSRRS